MIDMTENTEFILSDELNFRYFKAENKIEVLVFMNLKFKRL